MFQNPYQKKNSICLSTVIKHSLPGPALVTWQSEMRQGGSGVGVIGLIVLREGVKNKK